MTSHTYLISLYFDEQTNQWLSHLMKRISKKTGNDYMLAHQIPPHLTVAMLKSNDSTALSEKLRDFATSLSSENLTIASVGIFRTSVVFLQPVLNTYLSQLSLSIHHTFSKEQADNSRCVPYQWIPHISLAKHLSPQQQLDAISILQSEHFPKQLKVCNIGLSKTNPYEDIMVISLS